MEGHKARSDRLANGECSVHDLTFGGRCLRCGYDPRPDDLRAVDRRLEVVARLTANGAKESADFVSGLELRHFLAPESWRDMLRAHNSRKAGA